MVNRLIYMVPIAWLFTCVNCGRILTRLLTCRTCSTQWSVASYSSSLVLWSSTTSRIQFPLVLSATQAKWRKDYFAKGSITIVGGILFLIDAILVFRKKQNKLKNNVRNHAIVNSLSGIQSYNDEKRIQISSKL